MLFIGFTEANCINKYLMQSLRVIRYRMDLRGCYRDEISEFQFDGLPGTSTVQALIYLAFGVTHSGESN